MPLPPGWGVVTVLVMSDDRTEWDARYAEHEHGLWSGKVNGPLPLETVGLAPGAALDVGCGEGGDAIWLAHAGWHVTGVDPSAVALERAAAAAAAAGEVVRWIEGGIVDVEGQFDLVTAHYPAIKRSPGEPEVAALLGAVAPGGTVLVVGHGPDNPEFARSRGFDPADYLLPDTLAPHLGDGWAIEVHELRERVLPTPAGSPWTHDVVLRARRQA
jgi:SAM-dependent methyltransferase